MSGTLDPRVVHEAAEWFVQLQSPEAGSADHEACARWRASHADHEAAWQKALYIAQRFGQLPSSLGMPALGRSRRVARREVLKSLLLLAGAAPLGWGGYQAATAQGWLADLRTARGERRRFELADGSSLELNSASAVDLDFSAECRRLVLRQGEMLLHAVTEARPLVVRSADGCMRAQGGRFNVRQEGGVTRVAVLDGVLEVRPGGEADAALQVHAGQQLSFERGGARAITPLAAQVDAWTRGLLVADGMRLADFAAELQRYRAGFVSCADAVAELRLSGAFQLANTTPVLDSLAQVLPVRVVYRTRYWASIQPA